MNVVWNFVNFSEFFHHNLKLKDLQIYVKIQNNLKILYYVKRECLVDKARDEGALIGQTKSQSKSLFLVSADFRVAS